MTTPAGVAPPPAAVTVAVKVTGFWYRDGSGVEVKDVVVESTGVPTITPQPVVAMYTMPSPATATLLALAGIPFITPRVLKLAPLASLTSSSRFAPATWVVNTWPPSSARPAVVPATTGDRDANVLLAAPSRRYRPPTALTQSRVGSALSTMRKGTAASDACLQMSVQLPGAPASSDR